MKRTFALVSGEVAALRECEVFNAVSVQLSRVLKRSTVKAQLCSRCVPSRGQLPHPQPPNRISHTLFLLTHLQALLLISPGTLQPSAPTYHTPPSFSPSPPSPSLSIPIPYPSLPTPLSTSLLQRTKSYPPSSKGLIITADIGSWVPYKVVG